MRKRHYLNYITKLQNSSAISGRSIPPYKVIPVLEELGAALHGVVREGQAARVDQQDGVQLTLAPRAHLLLLHTIRQREQQQHSGEHSPRTSTHTHTGACQLLRPVSSRRIIQCALMV